MKKDRSAAKPGPSRDTAERPEPESALQTLTDRLNMAVSIARLGLYELDLASGQVNVNDQYLAHLGYAPGEITLTPDTFWLLMHPEDQPRIRAEFERHLVTRTDCFQDQYRLKHRDGRWIWIADRAMVVARDTEGPARRIVGVHLDFTEQKSAEQGIRDALALQQAVIASLQDGFSLIDPHGMHLNVNDALCRMTGFSREELIGKGPPHPYWPPEHLAAIDHAFRQTLAGGPAAFELTFMRKNGERFPVIVSPSIIRDPTGQIDCFPSTIKDISELRRAEEALLRTTEELDHYFTHAEDLFLIAGTDAVIRRINPRWEKVFGYSMEELVGTRILDRIHPDDLDATLRAIETLSAQTPVYNLTNRYRCKDGRYRYIEWNASAPKGTIIIATARDITDRRETELKLVQASAVFESTHDGVVITDSDEHIVAVNQAFVELTGYTREEVLGKTPRLLKSEHHSADFYRQMWQAIEASGHWQGEVWNRRKTGQIYPELLTVSAIADKNGTVSGYVGVCSDISSIKSRQQELEHLAHHDPLTGLINRRLLEARLEHALQGALRAEHHGALLLIDLDRFKEVNDRFGHPAGDEALVQIARRFQRRLRRSDSLARIGGDEFAVMLDPPMNAQTSSYVAFQLLDALEEEIPVGEGTKVSLGASIGIGLFPEHGRTLAELFRHTDAALYQAKCEGRKTFRFFTEELTQKAREQLRMEERLRTALKNDELKVYYQAQMDIPSGRIIGAEALVRWLDATEGLILPERFIGLSERTRLIMPLGDWVLRTACQQLDTWIREGLPPIRLAVNLSAFQAAHPDTFARVVEILTETGFIPEALELELTETSLRPEQLNTVNLFVELRHLGVTVALDDFGTGYSSLANLEKYPVSALKIDRRFIAQLPDDPGAVKITLAILGLAQALGFRTIAEGVETAEQLAFLAAAGCDACQGYYFGPPLPAEDFAQRYLRAKT